MSTIRQAPPHEKSLRYLKGVGPQRMQQLAQLGLQTVEDACYTPPRRYEDRRTFVTIRDLLPGALATVRGRVRAKGVRRSRRGQPVVQVALEDATGVCYGIWFNQPYLAQQLQVGDELILYGKVEPGKRRQLIHPEIERVEDDGDAAAGSVLSERGESKGSIHMGRIVPIYSLTGGITQRWLRSLIAAVLERYSAQLDEPLPAALREARGWPDVPTAVRELHFPTSWETAALARERLAFEELLLLQLALVQRRAATVGTTKPQRYEVDGPLTRGLRARLPFALTRAQERALAEGIADLAQPHPMHRLLQGDVGCGKTIVIALLIASAAQSSWQAALMAPTELLAEQHARLLRGWLEPLGVSVGAFTQGLTPAARRQQRQRLAEGTLQVAVGTHALLERDVSFPRLALVVIDEQHKFGVAQRALLARKAAAADVLVTTATPIPRTLALSLYGDLAISTIDELPPGRRPITTRWMREAQREELYALIRRELSQGRQGYVVYPLVEEGQATELKAATRMVKHLQAVFPEFGVGLLHGQMPPRTKDQVMQRFARGELDLLVSTVIVEVGLDVPNATIMVIEHPERFGLAQLHQLRGRIGRGTHPATCVVVSDVADEAALQRLTAFTQTTDGFRLAEYDLEQRGPGQLLGRRQHGWLRFRIAELIRDRPLLELARTEAQALIERDAHLRDPALEALRRRLARFKQQAKS